MKKKIIIIETCLLVAFVILSILVINGLTQSFDDSVYNALMKVKSPMLTIFLKAYTELGGPIVLLIITALLIIWLRKFTYSALIILNLGLVYFLNVTIKEIIARPRPVGINLILESGFSFPSGHAMVSTAFYGYLSYIICQKIKKEYRFLVNVAFLLIVLFIGISRIYLGVHFASDVIGGFILGLAWVIGLIYLTYLKGEAKSV